MKTYQIEDLHITPRKTGSDRYIKASWPVRYGEYSEIRTRDHIFHFNLNGEIKHLKGTGEQWPEPSEWLKRTVADDWVYYFTAGYTGSFDLSGEYYLPCLSYPTNAVAGKNIFKRAVVRKVIENWERFHTSL